MTVQPNKPNVADTITVTDSPTLRTQSYINGAESITVSESLPVNIRSFISTSDSLALTDSPVSSVYYPATASETASVNEFLAASMRSYVPVSDVITASEINPMQMLSYVSAADPVSAGDLAAITLLSYVTGNDSIAISDTSIPMLVSLINQSDSVLLSELSSLAIAQSLTNPSAWWKLDEASGTRMDSAGFNHLTSVNGVTQASGKIVFSAHGDSASLQYLKCLPDTALQTGSSFSIAGWVYLDSVATPMTIASLLDNETGAQSWAVRFTGS